MNMLFGRAAFTAAFVVTAGCAATSEMKVNHVEVAFNRSGPKIVAHYAITNEAEVKAKQIEGYGDIFDFQVPYSDGLLAGVKTLLDAHFQSDAPNGPDIQVQVFADAGWGEGDMGSTDLDLSVTLSILDAAGQHITTVASSRSELYNDTGDNFGMFFTGFTLGLAQPAVVQGMANHTRDVLAKALGAALLDLNQQLDNDPALKNVNRAS